MAAFLGKRHLTDGLPCTKQTLEICRQGNSSTVNLMIVYHDQLHQYYTHKKRHRGSKIFWKQSLPHLLYYLHISYCQIPNSHPTEDNFKSQCACFSIDDAAGFAAAGDHQPRAWICTTGSWRNLAPTIKLYAGGLCFYTSRHCHSPDDEGKRGAVGGFSVHEKFAYNDE